jgi:hypothetical protein
VNYKSGYADGINNWVGKFSNQSYKYFARHDSGKPIDYTFNSLGYRGPEHHAHPDISVFGSSFSFGVGLAYNQCWHQLLGDLQVNTYTTAGFLVSNNDIIDHYKKVSVKSGITIIQLREFKYNKENFLLPNHGFYFVIDEIKHSHIPTLTWSSFIDRAEDDTHPGPNTHLQWSKIIKKMFNM